MNRSKEPENPYDPNAIKVMAEGAGPIGYLSRENAVDTEKCFRCCVSTITLRPVAPR